MICFDGTMPRSNRSIVSRLWALVATMLSLALTMMMGHGDSVRIPVRQRDIRRVLRCVLSLVQGLLSTSGDGGHSGSETDSHGDDDADDRNHQRVGHMHPVVSRTSCRTSGGAPSPRHGTHEGSPLETEEEQPPMREIRSIVEDVDVDNLRNTGSSSSAPNRLAGVCLHLRLCRRGSNMHMLKVTCRDCGKILRPEPRGDLV